MGTGAFVSVGTAGSLQRDLDIGDLVLCEAAIRDEGVSHHYLPPAKLATADAGMTAALGAALGTPCPVPVREFLDDRHSLPGNRRRGSPLPGEGVLCVEMEAAALFAVAEVRRLQSPRPSPSATPSPTWSGTLNSTAPRSTAGLITLYNAAVSALQAIVR